jgi:outer membrane lipoprotein-sorting protein
MKPIIRLLLIGFAYTRLHAETLSEILSRMDQAAAKFQSFSAKVKRSDFTAVISETTETTGSERLRRGKAGMEGVVEFSDPDPRILHFSGRNLEILLPKANTVEIYDFDKKAKSVDEFVMLGFGTSGADLSKGYEIKLIGPETLGGVKTTKLELFPKNQEAKKLITRIELWIPEGQTYPLQEKLTQPSKNYTLAVFSDVKINPPLADADFAMKLPAGVKKLYPQK